MAKFSVNKRYTGPATNDLIFTSEVAPHRTTYAGVMVTASNGNTNSPSVVVKCGSRILADHPGVPPGGGIAFPEEMDGSAGCPLTVTCDDPGGTLAVTVYARMDE